MSGANSPPRPSKEEVHYSLLLVVCLFTLASHSQDVHICAPYKTKKPFSTIVQFGGYLVTIMRNISVLVISTSNIGPGGGDQRSLPR